MCATLITGKYFEITVLGCCSRLWSAVLFFKPCVLWAVWTIDINVFSALYQVTFGCTAFTILTDLFKADVVFEMFCG